jgi:solute carrier family 25 carnitine/acylcarnitine transporter 20/29
VNAVIFGSYGFAKRWLQTPEELSANKDLTLLQHAAAGAFGGFTSAVVVSPIELVKTQLQIQTNRPGERALIGGPVECALGILKLEGIRGIYRGLVPTIVREIPGYAGQFFVYEAMKRVLTTGSLSHVDNSKLGGKEMMLAGGIAGIGAWVFCYPQDVIKSRLQAGTVQYRRHRYLPDGGFIDAGTRLIAEQGYKGLWRGFATCCARAFPANAAGFLGYEATLSLFSERNVSWW